MHTFFVGWGAHFTFALNLQNCINITSSSHFVYMSRRTIFLHIKNLITGITTNKNTLIFFTRIFRNIKCVGFKICETATFVSLLIPGSSSSEASVSCRGWWFHLQTHNKNRAIMLTDRIHTHSGKICEFWVRLEALFCIRRRFSNFLSIPPP